jgi:N-dimethylarginine dimethylaminohydrolase
MPRILMCPPTHYGIHYEINPWMKTERQADHALAQEQWRALREQLMATGATIEEVPPVEGLPDLVFTANAAMIFQRRAVISHFKHEQRQGEEEHFRRWLAADGFEILETPAKFSFEGAGDALFCGDTLFAGYRQRSDALGHQQIGEMLGVRVLPLELIDAYYYHLDTCFCPLAPGAAIYFPGAFDDYGRRVLTANVQRSSRSTPRKPAASPATPSSRVKRSSPTSAAPSSTTNCEPPALCRRKRPSASSSKPAAAPSV